MGVRITVRVANTTTSFVLRVEDLNLDLVAKVDGEEVDLNIGSRLVDTTEKDIKEAVVGMS